MQADDKRLITLDVTVAVETTGDASLAAIARDYEKTPMLPTFTAGLTNPMGTTVCTVTRVCVRHISEQQDRDAA